MFGNVEIVLHNCIKYAIMSDTGSGFFNNRKRLISLNKIAFRSVLFLVTPLSFAILVFMWLSLSKSVEHLSKSIIKTSTDETVKEMLTFFSPSKNALSMTYKWLNESSLNISEPEALNRQFIPLLDNLQEAYSMHIANTEGSEYMLLHEKDTWVNRIVSRKDNKYDLRYYRWQYDNMKNLKEIKRWTDTINYNPLTRPWFISAMKADSSEMRWTKPYIFFTTKDPGMTVSMNWQKNRSAGLKYVISLDIKISDISKFTSNLTIGKNGKVFILTDDNKIVGMPRDVNFQNEDTLNKYLLHDYSDLKIKELTDVVSFWNNNNRTEDPFRITVDNKRWWAGFYRLKLGFENVYSIAVIVPEQDFMAEVNRSRAIIVIGFILIQILSILVIRGYRQKKKAYELLEVQKNEISRQRDQIEIQSNEITDSIRYSKRIQVAVMPPDRVIKTLLPEHFVFYLPKDIVSGDFYWVEKVNNNILWAAVDCTGHGVPGAIMSIIGITGLNKTVKEYNLKHPGEILDKLNHIVAETFRQDTGETEDSATYEEKIRDGMDLALCSFNKDTMEVEYAGAHNSLIIVRNGNKPLIVNNSEVEADYSIDEVSLYEIRAERQPIGSFANASDFRNNIIPVEKGDSLYVFTDGIMDQFGGTEGKKFMRKQTKTLLMNLQSLPVEERKRFVEKSFYDWKGNYNQIDDVLLFGVRI